MKVSRPILGLLAFALAQTSAASAYTDQMFSKQAQTSRSFITPWASPASTTSPPTLFVNPAGLPSIQHGPKVDDCSKVDNCIRPEDDEIPRNSGRIHPRQFVKVPFLTLVEDEKEDENTTSTTTSAEPSGASKSLPFIEQDRKLGKIFFGRDWSFLNFTIKLEHDIDLPEGILPGDESTVTPAATPSVLPLNRTEVKNGTHETTKHSMEHVKDGVEKEGVDPTELTVHELLPRAVGNMTRESVLPGDNFITLINGTPYPWKRVYIHQYQMHRWDEWPEIIEPGKAITHQALTTRQAWNRRDTAGEVSYKLEGTSSTMVFTVGFKLDRRSVPSVKVTFHNDLKSDAAGKRETIDLGNHSMKEGGVGFFLAGKEGNFTSSEPWKTMERVKPPANWMHSLYPELGALTLREVILPRAHHAAMKQSTAHLVNYGGRIETTVCQAKPIKLLLEREGVRVLDTRVSKDPKVFREYHGSWLNIQAGGRQWHGAMGQDFKKVVEEVNNFNGDYPGELIIWDIHEETRNFISDKKFSPEDRVEFFELLKGLYHRVPLPEGQDVSKLPLNDIYTGKKGFAAVILRFHKSWKEAVSHIDGGWPGAKQGFVTSDGFPIRYDWSDMYEIEDVTRNQLSKLETSKPHRSSPVFDLQWIRTWQGGQYVFVTPTRGLVELGHEMMPTLRDDLWNRMTDDVFPNWITLDGFDGAEMRGFTKAMNRCFVLRQCGDWVKKPRI